MERPVIDKKILVARHKTRDGVEYVAEWPEQMFATTKTLESGGTVTLELMTKEEYQSVPATRDAQRYFKA